MCTKTCFYIFFLTFSKEKKINFEQIFLGDFILLDNKKFELIGTWLDRNKTPKSELPKMNNDFWYQPGQNLMISTESGISNEIKKGFDPNHLNAGL